MRSMRFALAAASLIATTASASPTNPGPDVEYTVLATPQPSQTAGKKVEVMEFFMYHCPYCHALEPTLEQWVRKQGDNIVFRRMQLPYQGPADPEAHLFLTLQAMGKNEEYQARIMDAVAAVVQRKRSETLTEKEILDLAAGLPGLDKAKFRESWDSFGVRTMQARLAGIVSNNYKIDSVPTIVVDGKYVTSPGKVGETAGAKSPQQAFDQTLQVVDALVVKVQTHK